MSRTDLPVSAGMGAVAPGTLPAWRMCGVPPGAPMVVASGVLGPVAFIPHPLIFPGSPGPGPRGRDPGQQEAGPTLPTNTGATPAAPSSMGPPRPAPTATRARLSRLPTQPGPAPIVASSNSYSRRDGAGSCPRVCVCYFFEWRRCEGPSPASRVSQKSWWSRLEHPPIAPVVRVSQKWL